ncbi:MAG: hypothetical protein JWN64_751 [Parcubacteria group bacterium]|nr:hypothetical protein [Parcubacteria group bacterium]
MGFPFMRFSYFAGSLGRCWNLFAIHARFCPDPLNRKECEMAVNVPEIIALSSERLGIPGILALFQVAHERGIGLGGASKERESEAPEPVYALDVFQLCDDFGNFLCRAVEMAVNDFLEKPGYEHSAELVVYAYDERRRGRSNSIPALLGDGDWGDTLDHAVGEAITNFIKNGGCRDIITLAVRVYHGRKRSKLGRFEVDLTRYPATEH